MLEAYSHLKLKAFLQREISPWPHNLTLSRLIGRSLRRGDNTIIQLGAGSHDYWWPGLLAPLSLATNNNAIVLSSRLKRDLFNIEIPRLKAQGLVISCSDGTDLPEAQKLWIIDFKGLIDAYESKKLKLSNLVVPEASQFYDQLQDALLIKINPKDWQLLISKFPSLKFALIQLYERISRRLFAQSSRPNDLMRIELEDILSLKALLHPFDNLPLPWSSIKRIDDSNWVSWAVLDHKLLTWCWNLKPLNPFKIVPEILLGQPITFLAETVKIENLVKDLKSVDFRANVHIKLGQKTVLDPIYIYAPPQQPLPNNPIYFSHLLDQSKRLILGCSGLTIILIDDQNLLQQLATNLASEFGQRVVYEEIARKSNTVICCSFKWWIQKQKSLPSPKQLIVGLLPFPCLEDPFTAARVESIKQAGGDWFRQMLLPEALNLLDQAITPLRASWPQVAILDGRLRSRTWGKQVFKIFEPWTLLQTLLPR